MKYALLISAALTAAAAVATTASAQPNPSPQETENARGKPCADPWVSIAVQVAKRNRPALTQNGTNGECNILLYNNARWGSYAELLHYVRPVVAAQQLHSGPPYWYAGDPAFDRAAIFRVSGMVSNVQYEGEFMMFDLMIANSSPQGLNGLWKITGPRSYAINPTQNATIEIAPSKDRQPSGRML